jgi:hypothetical protein
MILAELRRKIEPAELYECRALGTRVLLTPSSPQSIFTRDEVSVGASPLGAQVEALLCLKVSPDAIDAQETTTWTKESA